MIVPDDVKIYMVTGTVDLRKGIDGYTAIIQDQLHMNPFDNAIFIFCNKNHNKIKIIYWDSTGFWLLYHRFEKGTIRWKKDEKSKAVIITKQQYRWLMEGLKTDMPARVKMVEKEYA